MACLDAELYQPTTAHQVKVSSSTSRVSFFGPPLRSSSILAALYCHFSLHSSSPPCERNAAAPHLSYYVRIPLKVAEGISYHINGRVPFSSWTTEITASGIYGVNDSTDLSKVVLL